jgi:uroporphyrinogen decarboxylase
MGLTNFAVRVYRDFPFVDRAFEIVEERNRLAIDTVIREVRPDVVLFDGDCSYKHGLMVDPGIFRRLVFEKTRKTVAHLKEIDIPYVLHTDGKLDDVIPLLIELGFSMVHGCESKANDLGDLVNRFGDDIVLAGNMDIDFLSRATIPVIRRETISMLETGSQKCKFVAACNTSPMDFIPDENYIAMAETIRDFPGRENCPV